MNRVLVIPGRPVPKARPRVVTQDGRSRTYTPEATRAAEELIRGAWLESHGRDPLAGPVGVKLTFSYGVKPHTRIQVFPLSDSPYEGVDSIEWEAGWADVENLAKLVLDALEGVAYHNDRQVAYLEATKERR